MRNPLLLLLLFAVSPAAATIPLNSVLLPTSTTPWATTPLFSLLFLASPTNPTLFHPSIVLSSPPRTPIWSLPVSVPDSGSLRLLLSGDLALLNPSGATVWSSNTSNRNVTSADLLDSGNFVLSNSSGGVVWESFNSPTDTVLTGQEFGVRDSLRSGEYSFSLQRDGNLTLKWNNNITYYNKGLNSSFTDSLVDPKLSMQPSGRVVLTDSSFADNVVIGYSTDYGPGVDLRYLRLDSDGNLRAYSYKRADGVVSPEWSVVEDQCEVYGWCGPMGVCSYGDGRPICGCPSGDFVAVDRKDARKGCRRLKELQTCVNGAGMVRIEGMKLLTYPPELSADMFFNGIAACESNCLADSGCVGSTSLGDGSGWCYLKKSAFFSAQQSPAIPSTSFIKVCDPISKVAVFDHDRECRGSARLQWWVIAIPVFVTLVMLVLLEYGLWWWCCSNSPKYGPSSARYALIEYASGAPMQFSYKDLHRSTRGFKEKLGEGGFGAVYKGILPNKSDVAVKQLEGIEQGEKQFRMEVATISSTHHLNLVRLIGFCSEGRHRLLVYEFMKNRSLDTFLFSAESSKTLQWEVRFNIALGTAKGITYLHEECRDCIVHCDIKPENILLDENYRAKVSDFGLAKLINPKDHRYRTLTSVRGTRGYLAPEWLANLSITPKSDVYSFGMVLLEIVSGRRNFEVSDDTRKLKFSVWAYEEFSKGNLSGVVDKRLLEQEVNMIQVEHMILAGFWCIQDQPSQRPSMGKVLQMLEGVMEIETPPAPRLAEGSMSITSGNISFVSASSASVPFPSELSSTGGSVFHLKDEHIEDSIN